MTKSEFAIREDVGHHEGCAATGLHVQRFTELNAVTPQEWPRGKAHFDPVLPSELRGRPPVTAKMTNEAVSVKHRQQSRRARSASVRTTPGPSVVMETGSKSHAHATRTHD